jgi:hypothetical protein
VGGTSLGSWTVDGHIASRLDGTTAVSLADSDQGCTVVRQSVDGAISVTPVPADACANGALTMDPDGLAWVGTGQRVVGVGDQRSPSIAIAADIVVWDVAAEAFYGFQIGEAKVSAWERTGAPRWSVATEGPVRAVAAADGSAAVSVELAGEAELLLLDGRTGAEVSAVGVDGGAGSLRYRDGVLVHQHWGTVDSYQLSSPE